MRSSTSQNCPGCNAEGLELGSDGDFARYGTAHGIAILKPCQGAPDSDAARFLHNYKNLRGIVDVYGQLSADYATQTGHQMAPIGARDDPGCRVPARAAGAGLCVVGEN